LKRCIKYAKSALLKLRKWPALI